MKSHKTLSKLLLLMSSLVIAVLAQGCSATVGAVSPRPNVMIGAKSGPYAIDVAHVRDVQEMDRVTVEHFRQSIHAGFRNAVGARLAPSEKAQAFRLVVESADLELSNLGNLGRFLTIRFRARWYLPDGTELAGVAGVAQPRNPTETGDRHLEDVIEVMLEKMIDALDESMKRQGQPGREAASPVPVRSS
jgi:hypothetical protein